MLIVDSQVHIWSQGLPGNKAHRQITSYSVDDLLSEMDEGGVDAAVIHPPAWDPNSNEIAKNAAMKFPTRLAILGNFPLDHESSKGLVDTWNNQTGMLGLRFSLNQPHQSTWPTDGTMDWLWPAADKAGLPVGLAAANFMPVVGRVAEQYPNLKLIVDHMGRGSGLVDDAAWESLPQLLDLARFPNVAVKASGAPSYSSQSYPYQNIHDHIHKIYDAFGPDRMFWGTDITRMPCSWKECVTLFTEELSWLTDSDKELIMGRALCKWIGWDVGM